MFCNQTERLYCTLVILTADGAPGNPGWQVLNSLTGLKSPKPQLFSPATLSLYVTPEANSCFSCPVKLRGPGSFHYKTGTQVSYRHKHAHYVVLIEECNCGRTLLSAWF